MEHGTKTNIRLIGDFFAWLIFCAVMLYAPALIQTEFFSDKCGFGFINETFGGYYLETGCKQ